MCTTGFGVSCGGGEAVVEFDMQTREVGRVSEVLVQAVVDATDNARAWAAGCRWGCDDVGRAQRMRGGRRRRRRVRPTDARSIIPATPGSGTAVTAFAAAPATPPLGNGWP